MNCNVVRATSRSSGLGQSCRSGRGCGARFRWCSGPCGGWCWSRGTKLSQHLCEAEKTRKGGLRAAALTIARLQLQRHLREAAEVRAVHHGQRGAEGGGGCVRQHRQPVRALQHGDRPLLRPLPVQRQRARRQLRAARRPVSLPRLEQEPLRETEKASISYGSQNCPYLHRQTSLLIGKVTGPREKLGGCYALSWWSGN